MALADIIIIVILLIFTLAGLRRGIIWEVFTTVGLVLGFGLVYYFRAEILDLVVHITRPGWERQWGGTVLFLVFFLVVYLGFAALGRHIHIKIKSPVLKTLDHGLGLAAGLLKGAVLIALLVMTLEWLQTGGKVRAFMYDSEIIRWGKQAVYSLLHWESPESSKWVFKDASSRMNLGKKNA